MEYLGYYTTIKMLLECHKILFRPTFFRSLVALGFDDTQSTVNKHSRICVSIIVNMKMTKDTFRN